MLFDKFRSLVFIVISAVEVGRFSRELSGTGINHLVYCVTCLYALVSKLLTRQLLDSPVKIAVLLRKVVFLLRKFTVLKPQFKFCKVFKLGYKPLVDSGYIMYLLNAETSSQCLEYAERTVNIDIVELCSYFFVCQLLESLFTHRVHTKLY